MRAIIRFRLEKKNPEKEDIKKIIEEVQWMPNLDQNDDLILSKKELVFENISDETREFTEKTFLYTIYYDRMTTWGIVSSPAGDNIVLRLIHDDSGRLMNSCEAFVKRMRKKSNIKFVSTVEVREPGNNNMAYSGKIMPQNLFRMALKERPTEWKMAISLFILSIGIMMLTSPFGYEEVLAGFVVNGRDWDTWVSGNFERIGSAVLVSSVVLFLDVILHWLRLKRVSVIKWAPL